MHLRRLRPAPAHPATATGSSPHLHLHLSATGASREDDADTRAARRIAVFGLACEVMLVGNLLAMLFR